MTPSSNHEANAADQQKRNRLVAGLLAGGAVVVTSALALPALASQDDSSNDVAQASETSVAPTTAAKPAAPVAPVAVPVTAPAPDPVELFTASWNAMTPEQQFLFRLYVATPDERAAYDRFFNPPPPPPAPAPVVKPAPAPKPAAEGPAPKPAPAPAPAVASGGGGAGGFLACLRKYESGGNYRTNTGNGYYGAYQFLPSTWNSIAASSGRSDLVGVLPSNASPGDQDAMAQALMNRSGKGQWPVASKKC